MIGWLLLGYMLLVAGTWGYIKYRPQGRGKALVSSQQLNRKWLPILFWLLATVAALDGRVGDATFYLVFYIALVVLP